MARYIDADIEVSDYVTVWDCDCSEFGRQTVMSVDDLQYLPTADVVPKSEVEKANAEIERLKKYNTDVAFKHYNDGKADAASEIFAEIENNLSQITRQSSVTRMIAELKKKYTEETK